MADTTLFAPTGITTTHILISLFTLTTLAYVARLFYLALFHPLRDIPGPFLARFSRIWLFNQIRSGQSHLTFTKLHKKYGPVVRITPNLYSFDSPEDQKKICDIKGSFVKTAYYDTGSDSGVSNIFTVRDEKEHSDRRRKLASLYAMSSMVHYEDSVDRMNAVCVRKFEEFAERKELVQVPAFMQLYAFDVIGEISIDRSFGMMEAERDVDGMVARTHDGALYQGHVGIMPEFHPFIHQFGKVIGETSENEGIHEIFNAQLEKHRNELIEKPDAKRDPFITKLLKLEAAGKVNNTNMYDAIGGNIAAGSDTTGITLSAALYYLYRNPIVLAALRSEIDTMAADGKISDPVTFKEAQSMPYLQAVIQETLRIHSAAGYILERTVPAGGVELAGRFFPEGTHVGCQSWALHRNTKVYGDDADQFRPERFLETTKTGNTTARLATSFAFGGGTRTCIGKNISLLEMTKVIPQIVRKFDLVFVDEKPWELYTSWFVYQRYSCMIRLRGEA